MNFDSSNGFIDNTILVTRMNPDLAMDTADQKLLKSTGAGNLFMVFGEPDIELRTLEGDKLQVELRGLDVYDPTTGEIRSDSTDSTMFTAPARPCMVSDGI